jgi:hypothetical protein
VEISELGARHARAYGTIHHGDLESAKYPDAWFDVVVLHHVIEHADEPLALLRGIARILRPNGKLVLGTPDFDGAMARRFGDKFRLLHDPTHVSLFTNDSMHRALRDLGFVIERVEYPFFETRHFTKENLLRLFETAQVSPPFYGSFMTFFCEKPAHFTARASLLRLSRLAADAAAQLDARIAAARELISQRIIRGGKVVTQGQPRSNDVLVATAVGSPDEALLGLVRAAREVGASVVTIGGTQTELGDVHIWIPTSDGACIREIQSAILDPLAL